MQLGGNRQPWTACITESAAPKAMVRTDGTSKRNGSSCRSSQFACSSLAPPGTVERAVEICQNTFAAHLPPAVISKQSADIHMLQCSIQCATQGARQSDTFHSDTVVIQQYHNNTTHTILDSGGALQQIGVQNKFSHTAHVKSGVGKQLSSPLAQSQGPRCCSDQHTVTECQLHMVFVAKLATGRS